MTTGHNVRASAVLRWVMALTTGAAVLFAAVQFGLRLHTAAGVTDVAAVALYDGSNVSGRMTITMLGDYEVTRLDGAVFRVAPHEAKAVIRASSTTTPPAWIAIGPIALGAVMAVLSCLAIVVPASTRAATGSGRTTTTPATRAGAARAADLQDTGRRAASVRKQV